MPITTFLEDYLTMLDKMCCCMQLQTVYINVVHMLCSQKKHRKKPIEELTDTPDVEVLRMRHPSQL